MNRYPVVLLWLSLGCAPPTAAPFQPPRPPDGPAAARPDAPPPRDPVVVAPAPAPPAAPECLTEEPPVRVEATVKLLDPGKPPLVTLRYKPRQGTKQTMLYAVSSHIDTAGSPMPATDFAVTLAMTVAEAKAESATFSFSVTQVDVPAKPDTPPEVIEGIRASLRPWKGASGKGTVNLLGVIDSVALSEGAPLQIQTAMEAAIGQLPKDPVGVGAKWQIESVVHTGLVLRGATAFELVSLAGEQATIRHAMKLRSDPTPGPVICVGDDQKLQALSFETEGHGERILRLSRLASTQFKDTSVVRTETRRMQGDQADVATAKIEAVTTVSSK